MKSQPSDATGSPKEEITSAFTYGYPLTPETSGSSFGQAASFYRHYDVGSHGSPESEQPSPSSEPNPLQDALERLMKLENDQGNWDGWGTAASRTRHWWGSTRGNSQLFEVANEDDQSFRSGPPTADPLTPPATPVLSSIGDDDETAVLPGLAETLGTLLLNEEHQVVPVPSTPESVPTAPERRILPLSPMSPGLRVFSLKRPGSAESQASFAMRSPDGVSFFNLAENEEGTSAVSDTPPMRPRLRSRKPSVTRAMNFLKNSLWGPREDKEGESSMSTDGHAI